MRANLNGKSHTCVKIGFKFFTRLQKTHKSWFQPKLYPFFFSRDTGITSVPTFEFYVKNLPEVRQGFSGAQPVDTIIAVCSRLKNIAKM